MATATSLVTPARVSLRHHGANSERFDRRAIMIEAHRQFRLMRRYGWSFGRCLSFAWAKAREQRARASCWHMATTEFSRTPTVGIRQQLHPRIASPIL
jgi:hypothetical protein